MSRRGWKTRSSFENGRARLLWRPSDEDCADGLRCDSEAAVLRLLFSCLVGRKAHLSM